MRALFPADGVTIAIMMGVLEISKLVAAGWLHTNWRNRTVSFLHKGYLCLAIVALMTITAIGIYGYLAKGYLEQQIPLGTVELHIAQRQQQITTDQDEIKHLNDRQTQLDAAVNSLIEQKQVMLSQRLRNQQKNERAQIADDLTAKQSDIDRLTTELVPLKMTTNDVEAKLGPIKYVAELFGWTKPDIAVRMVILILMFAFDPLAVVLVLSGAISIREMMGSEVLPKPPKDKPAPRLQSEPFPPIIIPRRLDTDIGVHLEPLSTGDETDKQNILAMLQRNPSIIEEVIDTVIEWYDQHLGQGKL